MVYLTFSVTLSSTKRNVRVLASICYTIKGERVCVVYLTAISVVLAINLTTSACYNDYYFVKIAYIKAYIRVKTEPSYRYQLSWCGNGFVSLKTGNALLKGHQKRKVTATLRKHRSL